MQLTRAAQRRAGFSLVELVVTVALLSLLMMVAIPEVGAWLRNLQIRNTAESIQTGLQRARAEAVSRNRTVRFSLVTLANPNTMDNSCALATNGTSWVISIDNPATLCGTPVSPTTAPRIIASRAGGDGGTRTLVTSVGDGVAAGPASSIWFDNYGRPLNNERPIQTIDVGAAGGFSGARALRVVISQSGGVRMCDPAVTATTDPRRC